MNSYFKYLRNGSCLVGILLFFNQIAMSAPPANIPIQAGSSTAGALNTHNMEIIKQKEFENQERENFKRLQEKVKKDDEAKKKKRKKLKKGEIEPVTIDEESSAKPDIIKAKVEEFETKGVYIESVQIAPSDIIPQDTLNSFIEPIVGQNVFFSQIQEVVNQINNYYAEHGYITARAFLPQQTIEDGTVKIDLIEGKVGNIDVSGNKWTKDSYILHRLSAEKKQIFDVVELEQDVLKFNRYNNGVRLRASLIQGEEPGTTDIKIIADEKNPWHVMGLMDNAGRRTIGEVRGGVMAYTDSLLGYRDRLSAGAYFSRSSQTPFAEYSIPVNKYDGRVGALYSSSFSKITRGDYRMFNIKSRSHNYSLYYSHPLIRKPTFELDATVSGHYKQATTSFDGYDLYTDKITAAQAALDARWDTKRGIWYGRQSVYQAFPLIQSESKYFKYEGNFVRLHDFGKGIVGQLRANYQFVPQDVIPFLDQYQAGGLATIRGFSEGVLIGKSGFLISGELLFPIAPSYITVNKKTEPKQIPFIGKYVKALVFIDQAAVFPYKGTGPGAEGVNANDYLGGIGPGLRITLPKDMTARLYWGFPMINNVHETTKRHSRFHFEICVAPDIDFILKHRKAKAEKL